MAFFGEDGLQRQLKQAQRDLMAKDREIGTMHLSAKEKDDALKKLRQEIERLQEEKADLAGGAGPSSHHDIDSEENNRLKTQIRDLQGAMSKLQMDGNRLREEARQTSVQLNEARLRKISGASSSSSNTLASPSSSRSSRRRSTSLSTDSRVMDLEAEISILRQNAGSPIEVDSLKTQIANARRELNKAINEKISIESRARKEFDVVKNQLEDANYELDGLRRELEDGGSVSKKDLEKRQKAWEGERSELASRVQDLERLVAAGKEELAELRSAANEAERLKEELDHERSKQVSTPTPDRSSEVTRLTEEVASLQAELSRAQSTTPNSSSATSSDLTIRRLERKLEKAQRDTEALEESVDKAEEENQALRSAIALPGSPDMKADNGRVVELEMNNERLHDEVTQLHTQIVDLKEALEQLETSQARGQQAEEALQRVQESLEGKAAEWGAERHALGEQLAGLHEKVSEAEQAVTSKIGDIEAKEAELSVLSSSLATSEAQVQNLGRQLEDAAADSKLPQLEDELSAAKSTIETLTKEREESTQTSAELQAQLKSLTLDLSSSREDLQMDRAEMDVLRIQLADVSSKEAAARTETETVQEQLDIAIKEKTQVENELTELRTSFADRSTDSEADLRNGELLTLKSELDRARQDMKDKERELEQEIQGLEFIKEKESEMADRKIKELQAELSKAQHNLRDVESRSQARIESLEAELGTSQSRVQSLETELAMIKKEATVKPAPTSSPPDRLGLLYSKIQSLRAERDDLRLSLSFAQNESRFTIRAAQADRESAIEELEAVKSDLNKQLALHESLENEVSSVRSQLSEKEVKLEDVKNSYASATTDKDDVADKIAQYENEVASAKSERDHLVQELGESHRQIMELNHAMAMMRTSTDTDKRMRKISMERKAAEMPKITETSSGVAVDRGPISFSSSRRSGHARTKSEIASLVLPDQAQITGLTAQVSDLESQIKVLSGKLDRRNASIEALQRENEKLSMAQELSKESAEEFEELVTERDSIQSELDNLRIGLGTATSEIGHKVAQVLELEGVIAGLRSEQASAHTMAQKQTERIAELETSVSTHLAEIATALSAVDSHELTIEGVEQQLILSAAESSDQLRLLILNVLAQRQRLSHATDSWRRASNLLQYQTTALDTAKDQVKTLTAQVDAFEAERSAMSQQYQSHTQRAKALDTANERVHELESQVETLEGECAAMAEQLDVVSAREQALVKQTEEASATRQSFEEATKRVEEVARELSDAREEINRLQAEIITAKDALAATGAAKAQTETDLTQELAAVKAQLAASEIRASEAVDELKKLGSQIERLERLTETEGDSMDDDVESSQADTSLVERSEVIVNHTVVMVDSLRQHVASIETKLQDERTKSAELAAQSQALTARLAELEAGAQDAAAKEADFQALRDTVGETTRELQVKTETASNLSKLCETLRTQVSDLTNQLDQATESATDHTLALQTEKATLQKQLETASEKADVLRMEVSSTMTKNQRLISEMTIMSSELQAAKTTLAHTEKTVEDIRGDMEKLEREKEKTIGLLKYQETETLSRTNKVQSLERELQNYKAELSRSNESLAEQKTASVNLEAECAKLRSALVEAQASAGSTDDGELHERITELEASLMLKTQEVDEADDRTREAFKAKAKLDKKIAKLTRQLGDKELEMNTKRNKVIAIPDPTPVSSRPTSLQMAPPTSTIPLVQQRAPLRSVDNLEPAAHVVSTPGSLKRFREGDDEKPLPAEAIMLPPSAPSSITSKTPIRRSFTPKRTISGGAEIAELKTGARNIFGSGGMGARPNIFAPGE